MGRRKGRKIYQCDYPGCSRLFPRNYNLQVHRRVHYEHKPFECPHEACPKAFRWKSSLQCHMISHKGGARARRPPRTNNVTSTELSVDLLQSMGRSCSDSITSTGSPQTSTLDEMDQPVMGLYDNWFVAHSDDYSSMVENGFPDSSEESQPAEDWNMLAFYPADVVVRSFNSGLSTI
eukprot:Plantae.Rhodophyta-Purpureofilum_apyrenoidigerum.ctg14151.p1 GENE.Plantae.Rhodophyta-Purpureofilum_apyrenoidigerum.ctg14151~~Plantae.Rhodophyta-Purpureofilum_apyrenoidigerum.ctg14151.p1  ORF type:complete len:177 (-),score=16.04 Plantae.Rhodophyta-Purpureofilum_apyrenoidigerum.ctg14151:458-988(-)